jgi:single-stranded-DNA-specific exonuclease
VNQWNGAVEPRVVLGHLYPGVTRPAEAPATTGPADDEWHERLRAEVDAADAAWPPAVATETVRGRARRTVVDRRGASGVAAVAGLASSGEPVLVVCADAARRRALVEIAAPPQRYGGGSVALAGGAHSDTEAEAALGELEEAGAGVALTDWQRLAREPSLPRRFAHVVLIDPPPLPALEDLADRSRPEQGEGFLHLAWGDPEVDLSLRLWEAEWPTRASLGVLFRDVRRAAGSGPAGGADLRGALGGGGSHQRAPEIAARFARVLLEIGVLRWDSTAPGALSIVSSTGTDLERSAAYNAYRARCEEGKRFLNGRRQAR